MEFFRKIARRILGYNSWVYKRGSYLLNFLMTVYHEGINTWWTLSKLDQKKHFGELPCPIFMKKLLFPINIRPGTQDIGTILNNVVREEYGQLYLSNSPKWMIDAGAYIGDTAAYFLSKYKNLKTICLEPNPSNFEMAKLNLQPYGDRAILLKKGLYSTNRSQHFSGDQTGGSICSSGFEVECITISKILEHYLIPRIDILKMDIEGSEENIFSSKPENWLNKVGVLIVELHSPQIESLVLRILDDNGFTMNQYRSVWYCFRN